MEFNRITFKNSDRVAVWDDKLRHVKPQEVTYGWFLTVSGIDKARYGLIGRWEDYAAVKRELLNPNYLRFVNLPEPTGPVAPKVDSYDASKKQASDNVEYEEVVEELGTEPEDSKPLAIEPQMPHEREEPKMVNMPTKMEDLKQYAIGAGYITPEDAEEFKGQAGKGKLKELIKEKL